MCIIEPLKAQFGSGPCCIEMIFIAPTTVETPLCCSLSLSRLLFKWVCRDESLAKSGVQHAALSLNESALSIYLLIARVIEIIVSPAIWNWRRLIIRGPPPDNSYAAGFCFRSYLLKNFYSKHHWNFYNWTFIFDALLIKLKKYVSFCIFIRYVKILDYMGRVNLNLCCDQKFYWTCIRLQNLMKLIRI